MHGLIVKWLKNGVSLNMHDFKYKKAVQAVNYFALREGGKINKMKAYKLIWLADRLHLRKHGRPIIWDEYFALPFGSVPSSTKDLVEEKNFKSQEELTYSQEHLKSFGRYKVESIKEHNPKVFSQSDRTILELIYEEYGGMNQFELSDLSHIYPEWQKFEANLKKYGSSYKMSYLDFFNNPTTEQEDIFNEDDELLVLSKEYFSDHC